jgi:hypothetical protein
VSNIRLTRWFAVGCGLIGATAAQTTAVDIANASGLTVTGYGETFARVEQHDADNGKNTAAGLPGRRDETAIDFTSDLNLSLRYRADDFTLRADVFAFSKPQFGDNVLLEQAFIDWQASEHLVLRAGRFQTTWLGWEGYHTPELWRVNNSAVWAWQTGNHGVGGPRPYVSDGAGFKYTFADARVTAEAYVVEDLLGDGPGQRPSDESYGGAITWRPAGIGKLKAAVGLDPNSEDNGDGTASTGAVFDLSGDITAFRASGWFLAGQVQYHEHSSLTVGGRRFGDAFMALAMAAYRITEKVEVSAMVDFVDRGLDVGQNEIREYALAVLTRPRKQVRLNAEVFFWDETAMDADAYGAAAVLLVHLP